MIFFPVQVEERAEQTKYHAKMRKARFPPEPSHYPLTAVSLLSGRAKADAFYAPNM
jgi:hypothetical protein